MPLEPMKHRLKNKNWSCRKKDKIRQHSGASDRGIFIAFSDSRHQKTREEHVSIKKQITTFFDKLIVKNVQKELLYNKLGTYLGF